MEIEEIIDHLKRGRGYSPLVRFKDDSTEHVRLHDLLKTAPDMTAEYLKRLDLAPLYQNQVIKVESGGSRCHVPMLCALPFSKLPLALPKGL